MTKELILSPAACARPVVSRPFFIALLIAVQVTCLTTHSRAQSSDEQQVRSVVAQLFRAMELGDSAMAGKCFMPQVTVATVKTTKEGQIVLTRDSGVAGFLKAIGTPHPEKWYEEIWNVRVSIDGSLAQVWCDYAFYLGNKFSHCGVDAFQLYKDGGRWKIFHLADTRRNTECNIPADVVKKHAQ